MRGKVTLDFESEPPGYVRAYGYSFAEQNHGKDRAKVPFLVGAGLVVSRSGLSACGWSEAPVLPDRVGKRLVSGGDVEIVLRIAAAGYQHQHLRFDPKPAQTGMQAKRRAKRAAAGVGRAEVQNAHSF